MCHSQTSTLSYEVLYMSPKAKSKAANPVESLSFEQAYKELESIVRKLEGGQLPLDEALALFERGQALAARCGSLLEAAELKVQQLRPQVGGVALEDFEASAA